MSRGRSDGGGPPGRVPDLFSLTQLGELSVDFVSDGGVLGFVDDIGATGEQRDRGTGDPGDPARRRTGEAVAQALSAVTEGIGVGGVAALLTEDDPDYTRAIRAVLLRHRAALTEVVRAATELGALRAGQDAETLIDTIVGSHIIEHSRRGTVAEDWSDRIGAVLRPALLPE